VDIWSLQAGCTGLWCQSIEGNL